MTQIDTNGDPLQELQAYLSNRLNVQRNFNSHAKGNSFPYVCMEDFVLRHGQAFEQRLLYGYERGEPQQCFANSQKLAIADKRLTYVEGFACGIIPVHHAWCVDEQGRVIDVTWDESQGRAYFGVPMSTPYIFRTMCANLRWHSVLNDWENDFPLLSGAHDVSSALKAWRARTHTQGGLTL